MLPIRNDIVNGKMRRTRLSERSATKVETKNVNELRKFFLGDSDITLLTNVARDVDVD